jgi:UrcA family protein
MRVLLTAIAFAAFAGAAPAAARTGEEAYSVTIPYGDLNGDVRVVLHRVRASADRFCIGVGDSPLQQLLQAQQCRANFIHSAERKLWLDEGSSGGMRIAAR